MRFISFYLPQFHPIPENDAWWGKGFTEWTNVVRGKPRFFGHYQPHLPGDLGFYDLRLADTRNAQARLAREAGLDGFCYYHYWFHGRRLLGRPIDDVLGSSQPDLPFCFCWANENWTRAWDGMEHHLLIKQTYSAEDHTKHIQWLLKAFRDPRYIRVHDRPLFLIYRPDQIPSVREMLEAWRSKAKEEGLSGLYVCAVRGSEVSLDDQALLGKGFDAIVDFQPNRRDFPPPRGFRSYMQDRARRTLPMRLYQYLKISISTFKRIDYKLLIAQWMQKPWPTSYRRFPCVFPSWDNTARRNTPTIIQNNDPALFGRWLRDAAHKVADYPDEERLVFINAWNEWAEGCHLEPDQRYGHRFLDEVRNARKDVESP